MASALNPYSPGSGRRPPELADRQDEVDAFDLLMAKARQRLRTAASFGPTHSY
ncbi:hypothetical protein [Arthrobacter sp. ES3-54]|uniref:hypothetical protein n=1 Tax=Arthrobacter sp. ES3-54 TaxID=1502991 RepID=UPI0024064CFC|nr:hypothetical protein [Arthrobacter sp. ES3-54]